MWRFRTILLFIGLSVISQNLIAQTNHIRPCNPNIVLKGSNYITYENTELIAHRHPKEVYSATTNDNLFNPLKARTCAGITLNFKTASPNIRVKFKIIEGLEQGPSFAVFQDGEFYKNLWFQYNSNKIVEIDISSKKPGNAVSYIIMLPLKTDVHFVGLELEEHYDLETPIKENKKTYVAFGDSITHGTGQKTNLETYPYILSKNLDYQLYNLAVGGGKTSHVMAEIIRDDFKEVDLITILIGYNDYNGEGIDVETYRERYENVLNIIRQTHKNTKIYCISLLTTKMNNSKTSGLPIMEFRNVVKETVKKRQQNGDRNIFLIEGEQITSIEDLKDNVHLSIEGAGSFAEKLTGIIK